MDLKRLKFIQKGYETYTGPIGKFTFVDGLSTELIHRVDRDMLSTAFQFAEVDDDGNEVEAGVAARLVSEAREFKAEIHSLPRMTEEEKAAEDHSAVLRSQKAPTELYTRDQLETIAEKHGLKGLRTMVGDLWGVKNRSITLLIDEILVAQNNWIATRNGAPGRATQIEQIDTKPKDVTDASTGLTDEQLLAAANGDTLVVDLAGELAKDRLTAADLAAATGDLGAALNAGAQNEEGAVAAAADGGAVGEDPDGAGAASSEAAPAEDAGGAA